VTAFVLAYCNNLLAVWNISLIFIYLSINNYLTSKATYTKKIDFIIISAVTNNFVLQETLPFPLASYIIFEHQSKGCRWIFKIKASVYSNLWSSFELRSG
jgi:hypothetical protein